MPAVVGAAVTSVFASLPAVLALVLVLRLLLVVYDLHLEAADVERHRAEPEEGDAAHCGALEKQRRHGQEHHPPQGEEAADVRGAAEWHAHASKDEEGWAKKNDGDGIIDEFLLTCTEDLCFKRSHIM